MTAKDFGIWEEKNASRDNKDQSWVQRWGQDFGKQDSVDQVNSSKSLR